MADNNPNDDTLPIEIPEENITGTNPRSGIIGYFAYNPVAANLLMWFVLILGLVAYFTIQRQMFPNIELNKIRIEAVYSGASPQEIEEGILIKIEEALKDVSEIDRMVSRGFRDGGSVTLDVDIHADLPATMDKVKLRLDGIATFPAEMEPLTVYEVEFQQEAVEMALVGDMPTQQLKPLAQQLEDELLQLPDIALVEVYYPENEISIEVDPDVLRQYDLTLAEVSAAVAAYSANLSAGQVRSESGIISVRVQNQYYSGEEFNRIPVKLGRDGAKLLLGDIATIRDDFVEGEHYFKYSGKNAIYFSVNATKEQNLIKVADQVNNWIEARNKTLPQAVQINVLVDTTYYLNGRLDMMKKNLFIGALLVALMLSLFLRFKLAFWVMVGLPVCFLGAVMLMPFFNITINIVSLFGFIMVLGIVVDDAIVIGESAFSEVEKHGDGPHSVVIGAKRVATPATFGVLTTIAVFAPFAMSSGPDAPFFVGIAVVVMLCLAFSLVESKLILPAHLAKARFPKESPDGWRARFNARYSHFVNFHYRNFLEACLRQRWLVFSIFTGLLIVTFALLAANLVRFLPMPSVPHDYPSIRISMNENVPDTAVVDALKDIEDMVMQVEAEMIEEHGHGMIRDRLVFNDGRDKGTVLLALVNEDLRYVNAFDMARIWRERMPEIPGLKSIVIVDDVNTDPEGEGDFGFLLLGHDQQTLNAAGRRFMDMLKQQSGLYEISSTIDPVGKEIQLQLLPVAYDLGLTLADIATQVGFSFYGGEAQRVIRNGEELKVMVRYPELTRKTVTSLKYTLIKTPSGQDVKLGDVANLVEKPGVSYIRREDGMLSVYVYGAIDEQIVEPSEVERIASEELLPELQKDFPSISSSLGKDLEEQNEQTNEQIMFFVAGLLMIYILLAVPLKSYAQPIIIMSVIPFSLTGAIWGHFIFGMDLSMMSTFGIIAAAGVVINDSLVMTDYINQLRRLGISTLRSVVDAGCARFRPITLTSITTFAGVMPIMLEKSLQAGFVIPMAVSLGCSVLFATVITLLLVPCLYLMLEDLRRLFGREKASPNETPDTPPDGAIAAGGNV